MPFPTELVAAISRDRPTVVFDLDGNAAEWAVTEGGTGVAVGPSADLPDDPRSLEIPAPEYTAFRVVATPRASPLSDPLSEPSLPPS